VMLLVGVTPSLSGCSIVSRVLEKGFAGTCFGMVTSSFLRDSESELSKGSGGFILGVAGFVNISSPTVEVESGMDDVDGEGGGGDCTRTFFEAFLDISGLEMFEMSWKGIDC